MPKVKDPMSLEEYRPISLVGAIYKIISKVLANRMKNVLSRVILIVSNMLFLRTGVF